MLSFGADVITFMCEFGLVLVILYLTAMKYAVFGDSYVARLGRSDLPLCLPGEVRFFGRGGMRAGHVPNEEGRQLSLYSPDYVVLHLGGNDLSMESVPRAVGDMILSMVEELLSSGVRGVLVCQVVPRACVSRSPGLTIDSYERQRKSLNQILHRALGPSYVPLHFRAVGKDGKLHQDYATNRVHFSERGLVKYRKTLKRAFLQRC